MFTDLLVWEYHVSKKITSQGFIIELAGIKKDENRVSTYKRLYR